MKQKQSFEIKQLRHRLYALIACEESQAECKAFRDLGWIAYSCDIQPCRPTGNPDWHIQGDVTPYLQGEHQFRTQSGKLKKVPRWDLIIAHPPCTYICRVSSVQLHRDPDYCIWFNGKPKWINRDRFMKMADAVDFFYQCLEAKAMYVAVENPQPMALAELPQPSCYVEPYWFGHKYSKKTLYWLRNLPPIIAGAQKPNPKCYVHCSRGKYRSRTFTGVAQALAEQWTDYIVQDTLKIQNSKDNERD